MHPINLSVIASLALVAITGADPVSLSKPGECVALAAEWTLTNFAAHSGPGKQSTSFNFTDSLDRSTSCQYTFKKTAANEVAPSTFHKCENPALRFKYVSFGNVTLKETVSCEPTDGTLVATADVPLKCEVFGASSNCISQAEEIDLTPKLKFK